MSDLKDTLKTAGQKVVDTAKTLGHKLAEGAEQAREWVAEKTGIGGPKEGSDVGVTRIKERMDVIAACGMKVGVVDHVEGDSIKLTRKDSPDGAHHFIPLSWVGRVDSHVHLNRNSDETHRGWKTEGCCAS